MEPITLCGAVIVAFGLWMEFEAIIMKTARVLSKSTMMTVRLPSTKEQRSGGFLSPGNCRGCRDEIWLTR